MKNLLIVLAILLAVAAITACDQSKPDTQILQAPPVPVLTHPATAQQCSNGGIQITVGTAITVLCNGVDGNLGPAGPAGSPGLNSTPITLEQVCQGIQPSYPSTFPEYIMLIGTTAYGVYSQNGGFMALLPPGVYSSNGINASCTFTINVDGTISQ